MQANENGTYVWFGECVWQLIVNPGLKTTKKKEKKKIKSF